MKKDSTGTCYRWRYHLVLGFFILATLGVAWRGVYLQVLDKRFLISQGDSRILRSAPIPASRGIIQDRFGKPLAVSTPVTTLWANPKQLMNHREDWRKLARLLGWSMNKLQQRIMGNQQRSFMYLKRHMVPGQAETILNANLNGVYGQTEYKRYYPAGEVAAHIVGFTDIDERGQEGVELAYNDMLSGFSGEKRVVKDLLGRVVKSVGLVKDASPGDDITLSIDLKQQYSAYKELLAGIKSTNASAGSIVALDVQTGEVLAMANYPSYNPNNRVKLKSASIRNRAVTDVFEPGSTVKPLTVAAALETGRYNPRTPIDTTPGYMRVGRKLITDHRNYGQIDVTTVLTKSSNVGASKLALSISAEAVRSVFARVGLGEYTGIGFPGESAGLLPGHARWRPIEAATLSYGYGLSVTTLQLAEAYTTIANGGVRVPLSLVKLSEKPQGERVLREDVADEVVHMLETVVTDEGTASKAAIVGYRVAGKTGTVHKVVAGGYAEDKYVSLFAGMAPANDPKVVLVVMIDDPKNGEYYGGQVAAPIFANVMKELLRMNNVAPQTMVPGQIASRLHQGVPRS